jgi:hypothetical protein
MLNLGFGGGNQPGGGGFNMSDIGNVIGSLSGGGGNKGGAGKNLRYLINLEIFNFSP